MNREVKMVIGSTSIGVDGEDLAERVRAGSTEAFAEAFRRHAPAVHRVAWRLLGSVEADDVVQEVFLGLPRALRGWRGEGPLESWLKRIAVRAALMRLRSGRRRPEDPAAPLPERAVGRSADALIDAIALERALRRLPDALRAVFVLKAVEGYTHDEIAALLDITEEASRARLARARSELRTLLS